MQKHRIVAYAALAAALLIQGCSKPEPVDLILHNGKVLTVDENFSIRSAVAVKDGKILAVGGKEILRKYQAPRQIDLAGRVLMPGFNDTHIHIQSLSPRAVDIIGNFSSIKDIQRMVREKAEQLGPGEWITGYGWDEALFEEKRNLVKEDLDEAAPNNPVVLTRITSKTPDPEAGVIEKDANGEPNGIIRERSDLYYRHVPADTYEDLKPSYIASLKKLLPLGITSIIEATSSIDDEPVGAGGIPNPGPRATYKRWREIYPGAERLKAFPHHTGYGDERVRIGPIGENPVDGGFTGPAAWTLVDYKNLPGYRGKGRFTDEELQELVDTAGSLGWQLGLHAIGDAAIVQTVNAYSKAIRAGHVKSKDHRWFLDHFTIMPPDETMQTMAEDGIMIAQQPNFAYNLEGRYVETMDDWRLRHNNSVATPAKKFGLMVALGSDNLPIDPRVGLYVAVTRKGMSGTVYGPEEKVSIEEAIRMYTYNGAILTFEEKIKGSLEAGKLADMIVLDSDPLTIDPEQLLTMNVDMTIIGGKIVYERKPSAN
jgi:predicted amidohydrolase YtcJ